MATRLISFSNAVNETVVSGDKLVIRSRGNKGELQPSLAVFPASGGTAKVFFTHTPLDVIYSNPDDPLIKWLAWPTGDVTATAGAEDTFAGFVKAVKVEAVGGQVIVQGSVNGVV
jgi:hypothetical protein